MKKIFLGALFGFGIFANKALAVCTLNGEVIPCDQMPKWPLAILVVFFVGMIATLVFWVMMLIDVAKNEKDNDLIIWLLVLVILGVIGAVVYYFARKRGRRNRNEDKHKKRTVSKKAKKK